MALKGLLPPGHRGQWGQVAVIVGGGMMVFLGLVALSTDIGSYLWEMRKAQNQADSAALAGAQELGRTPPSPTLALQKAQEWAAHNDAEGQLDWSMDCSTGPSSPPFPGGASDSNDDGEPDTLCVGLRRSTPTFFARALGIYAFDVKRTAAARVVHAAGAAVCPWTLRAPDPWDLNPNDGTYLGVGMGKIYAVKVGAGQSGWGNFGVLKLYPTGSDYKEAIGSGCKKNAANLVMEGTSVLTETEPGNMGANTGKCLGNPQNPSQPCTNDMVGYFTYELSDGIQDGQAFDWCDVPMNWNDGTETGVPTGYDPAQAGSREGCGRDAANGESGRYLLVPVVDGFPPQGGGTVQILGVAAVYVAGWGQWDAQTSRYDRNGPSGQVAVYVQFVGQAPFEPKDLIGQSDNPLAPLRIVLVK